MPVSRRCMTHVFCPAAFMLAATLPALAGPPGVFEQIVVQPSGVGMFEPSLSADGQRVAFRTNANLTGQNPDGSVEVYVYDRDTRTTKQVTSTPGGSGTSIALPKMLPDGSKVVFLSLWNFLAGTPGITFQLWEVDVESGAYRQVTNNPANTPVFDPRMSEDGSFFVFLARINPTGQNSNGSLEVFRINRLTGATIQISDNTTASAAQFPDINGDGSVIVWGGRENYDGTNTNGGLEIWKWTENGGSPVITHVTNQAASVSEVNLPRVDSAGRYVVFMSLADFTGVGITGRKVFLADTLNNTTLTLLTNPGVGGSGTDYPDAEISPDGTRVYFESNRNLVAGQNADGNRELFVYNIQTTTLSQLTTTTGGLSIVSLSDDATRRYIEIAANGTIAYRTDQSLDPNIANGLNNLDLFIGACAIATVSPAAATLDSGSQATITATVRLLDEATYQWLRDGVPISEGSGGAAAGGGQVIGAAGAIASSGQVALTIGDTRAVDSGVYRLRINGVCGTEVSNIYTLIVNQAATCLADVASDSLDTARNPNNAVGSEDLDAFIAGFIADNTAIADVASDSLDTTYNPNGSVGSEDLDAFIASFIAGC